MRIPIYILMLAAILWARPAGARQILAQPGGATAARPGVRIDLSLKVAFKSGRRIRMRPALIVGSDKTATTIVRSPDRARPMEATITVHPNVIEGGKAVHLRLTVVVTAGEESLARTMEITTMAGAENDTTDETAAAKYTLGLIATVQ